MYSLTHALRPRFIDAVAYLAIPSYIQSDQGRTHDSSPLQTGMYSSSLPITTNKITQQPYPKPAESFLSSPPMTKISATTYIMSYFTSLHFNSDSNHSPAPHPLSHFTGCTALSLASSPVHFLHIGQTNLRWSTNLDYFP